MPSRLASEIAV